MPRSEDIPPHSGIPPRAYSHRTQRGPVGLLHEMVELLTYQIPVWWALVLIIWIVYLSCALITARAVH